MRESQRVDCLEQAVMKWVFAHEHVDPARVVLFGRSLGGAVAIYIASKFGDQVLRVVAAPVHGLLW
jgi:dienelactone hydrolase